MLLKFINRVLFETRGKQPDVKIVSLRSDNSIKKFGHKSLKVVAPPLYSPQKNGQDRMDFSMQRSSSSVRFFLYLGSNADSEMVWELWDYNETFSISLRHGTLLSYK